jgi:hypothetical protein
MTQFSPQTVNGKVPDAALKIHPVAHCHSTAMPINSAPITATRSRSLPLPVIA